MYHTDKDNLYKCYHENEMFTPVESYIYQLRVNTAILNISRWTVLEKYVQYSDRLKWFSKCQSLGTTENSLGEAL